VIRIQLKNKQIKHKIKTYKNQIKISNKRNLKRNLNRCMIKYNKENILKK
jgi:hypothetical protein